MKTVLIAGGSGLVGRRLTKILLEQGHKVRWLSRRAKSGGPVPVFAWDTNQETIDSAAFEGVNIVINLAGAGIADKKWTRSRKKVLIESRTKSAATLDKNIARYAPDLELLINASAIGYYGDKGEQICDESSQPGNGFLSTCCIEWEDAVHQMSGNFPKVIVRIGIVLSTKGGAMEKMLLPLKLRTNTYFGNGKQWMSWIHIDDLCQMIIHLISHANIKEGKAAIFNAVASQPFRNKQFVSELANALNINAILMPAPSFGLRLAMGEMADVVLESTRVSNQKIKDSGYILQYEDLTKAIQDLHKRKI